MPGARLAKNCLLWHYIRFLCLFFFKGKEKLKSPLRIGRWMYLAWRSREEHLRWSKVSWEKDQWLLSDHKHGLLHFPCFLRRHARSALAPQPASKPGQPPWPHTEPKVSCRELFWVRYILTCLPVHCCQLSWLQRDRVWESVPQTHQGKVISPKKWFFFSHSPPQEDKSSQLSTLKEITPIGCNKRCVCVIQILILDNLFFCHFSFSVNKNYMSYGCVCFS